MSLSARRAWIEMLIVAGAIRRHFVALRKESVDRNSIRLASSRAYIVALRKESVDRNLLFRAVAGSLTSRSPQGERG